MRGWMLCFLYAIVTLWFMLIIHKLFFYKEAVLRCFMLISLFFTSSKKGDNSINRMEGSVQSTFQEVQRILELEFSNASFMLSLHFCLNRLYGFYKDSGSPKQRYCMVLWFSVSLMLPQRSKRIREIGWGVRFGQHFRR